MSKQVLNHVRGAPPPLPMSSQVVISNGSVYVAGCVGYDEELIVVGGVQAQVRAALDCLKTILEGAGSGLENVVKVTVYLTNLVRDIEVFNEIYAEYFADLERLPARTVVGVALLPLGAFVEIDCVAELAGND